MHKIDVRHLGVAGLDPRVIPVFLWSMMGLTIAIFTLAAVASTVRRPRLSSKPTPVSLVIVSKAGKSQIETLISVMRYHASFFRGYKVKLFLVVDEGSEGLGRAAEEAEKLGYTLVVVPSSYSRGKAKARAINYFVETIVDEDEWYAFIDDDNLILDRSFIYELEDAERRGLLVGNPVLVPRPGRSLYAYIMDHVRTVDDLVFFRATLMGLNKPLIGLHGELLIAKGRVLREVGFAYDSLTEDYRFAAEAYKRGYRFFQSRTRVSILSPHSLRDLVRQRSRWFTGLSRDVVNAPLPMKTFTGMRLFMWLMGIVMAQALLPFYWMAGVKVTGSMVIFAGTGLAYYVGTYLGGSISAAKLMGPKALLGIIAIPIYSIVEGIAPYKAIASRPREFIVIEK